MRPVIHEGPANGRLLSHRASGVFRRRRIESSAPRSAANEWTISIWLIAIIVQLALLLRTSQLYFRRFSLTNDFAAYEQAWYMIGHGHLNPYITSLGMVFWRNNGEFILYLFAPLAYILPHSPVLLWLQDVAMAGAETIALFWIRDLTHSSSWPRKVPAYIAVSFGAILLLANPWTYWIAGFDFHIEPLSAFTLILGAWLLQRRRWYLASVAIAATLSAGSISASLVAALGLGVFLAGAKRRRLGVFLIVLGGGWVAFLSHLGMQGGNLSEFYGYLATGKLTNPNLSLSALLFGILLHPGRVVGALWNHRLYIEANLAPSGILGIVAPWTAGVAMTLILANNLIRVPDLTGFFFQYDAMYSFLAVGTVIVLARLARVRRLGFPLAGIISVMLVIDSLGWAAVWIPHVNHRWLRVSPSASRVLLAAHKLVPQNAEVIASQGVIGRFADRNLVYSYKQGGSFPIRARSVYFVMAVGQGIELAPVDGQLGAIDTIAVRLRATLLLHGHGIWIFKWNPPSTVRDVVLPGHEEAVPGWALQTDSGIPLMVGNPSNWYMASTGKRGYVVYGDYWREPVGAYSATVTLAATGPVVISVYNSSAGTLLAQRQLSGTSGKTQVTLIAANSTVVRKPVFSGAGPFTINRGLTPQHNQLEIRVWSAGHSLVNVYSVALRPVNGHPTRAGSRTGGPSTVHR